MNLPIALCVFDTAKGHFDRTDIYQRSIRNLNSHIPLGLFAQRVVHVKIDDGPNYKEQYKRYDEEIAPFYEGLGFEVYESIGEWKHGEVSHQHGYARDIIKMYARRASGSESGGTVAPHVREDIPFVLHWESDWEVSLNGQLHFDEVLEQAIGLLKNDTQTLQVRFPRFRNELDRLQNLKARHNLDVTAYKQDGEDYIHHNDHISLNPCLFRRETIGYAARLLDLNFGQLAAHVEMGFDHCFKWMSAEKCPYAVVDPNVCTVGHIGTKENEEDVPGQTYEDIINSSN